MKKFSDMVSLVSFLSLAMVSGIGPRNLLLLRLSTVSSVRFPMAGVKKPSRPMPSRSTSVTLLEELSRGKLHNIPRNCEPVISHGSTVKSQLLR